MSLTALQGATLIAAHATFTKIFLSFTLRTYQFLEWDPKRKASVDSKFYIQQYQKAVGNESEYAGLLTAILLFLSLSDKQASLGATLATVGQIGYVWCRTAVGYPAWSTIGLAVIRYGGMALLAADLWRIAF